MNLPKEVESVIRRLKLDFVPASEAPWLGVVSIPGQQAFAAWRDLADAARGGSVWPAILGHAGELESLSEVALVREDSSTLEEAFAATMTGSQRVDPNTSSIDLEDDWPQNAFEESEWPSEVDRMSVPAAVSDLASGKPHESVVIAIFAANHSWETLARLQYGNWNDCPAPEIHVARHRDWNQRFGSEICAITHDTVECVVARPPEDREAAMQLANEQYRYCYDIVEQGTGTITALAASLLHGPLWFFWWD